MDAQLRYVFLVLAKHWRLTTVMAACVVCLIAAGTFLAYTRFPKYEATVRLEIDPPGSEAFSMQNAPGGNEMDYVDTQAEVLKSDELALAVIRSLGLDQNPSVVGSLRGSGSADSAAATGEETLSPGEYQALRHLRSNTSVTPIRNTRVLVVKYSSSERHLSPVVANTLVSLFVERNYKTRYEAVMRSSEWLAKQLEDIRQKMVRSNEALAQYQQSHNIAEVDEKQSTVNQQISELNRQLTLARADRIQMEPYVKNAAAGDNDLLPQIRGNPMIQALTQRWIEVRAELSQVQAVFGKNSPNVQKLQNHADELEQQIKVQKQQIVRELSNNYNATIARENLFAKQMAGVTGQMIQVAEYNNLKREAQANSDLYNTLYGRIKEAGISAASKSSNVRVFDTARVLDKPSWPRPFLNLLVGLALGVVAGVVAAFAKEAMDATVRTPDDIRELTGSCVIALPKLSSRQNGSSAANLLLTEQGRSPLAAGKQAPLCFFAQEPGSAAAESIRGLRSAVLLARPTPPRTLLVASPFPSEGKTTVAINLAIALAHTGSTCLVDADLRNPKVAMAFGMPAERGLSDVLLGQSPLREVWTAIPGIKNLSLVPGGTRNGFPGELVLSASMRLLLAELREQAKFVIIDSPPMLPYADARTLAALADAIILVARPGSTTRDSLARISELLRPTAVPVIAFVLNGVDQRLPEYRYY